VFLGIPVVEQRARQHRYHLLRRVAQLQCPAQLLDRAGRVPALQQNSPEQVARFGIIRRLLQRISELDHPSAHVTLGQVVSRRLDQCLRRIAAAKSDVVLFVHGFNYIFDESLETTLRIVQRAKFPATPVTYGWPSQGKVAAYGLDNDMSEWTTDHLTDFIRDLAEAVPQGFRLHIVAHSMGNRTLLLALARLNLAHARLGQLILIAPDVDTAIFKVLISRSGPFQGRTLYVSNHDLALQAAGFLHSSTIRAGDSRKQFLVLDNIDTVDMSKLSAGIFGHSLDAYSQVIFEDLSGVLRHDTPAGRNLTACTVTSVQKLNEAQGSALPCTVYRLPSK